MELGNGRPRVEVPIVDLSVLISGGILGKVAISAETERGEINTPTTVRNWDEFRKYFGEVGAAWSTPNATVSPSLIKRIFNLGGTVVVSRLDHYTDIADSATNVSTAPTATIGTIVFTGKTAGDYEITVTVQDAANGVANEYDIIASLVGYPEFDGKLTYLNMPEVITPALATAFNNRIDYLNIAAGTIDLLLLDTVTDTVTGGTYDTSLIVEADVIGSPISATGLYSFDEITDIWRIAVPHLASVTLDDAIVAYVESRKDLRAMLRTPIGLTGSGILDYRNRTGAYVGTTPIDNHLASMTTGGLLVEDTDNTDPYAPPIQITELADALGWKGYRDNKNTAEMKPWFSSAGRKYPIKALGVVYNLAAPSKATEFDLVANAGVNPVVKDPDYGVIFGNDRTLKLANPNAKVDSALRNENVSELMVFMARNIKLLAKYDQFQPNDIETWKAIYRRISPFLDNMVEGRAIYPGWIYQGDQDVDRITEATINEADDIANSVYVARIFIQPIGSLKYIRISLNVTSLGVNLVELAEVA